MNLANKLTILRIILAFIFIPLLLSEGFLPKLLALFCFACASITDFLDGYIARKYHLVTDLGKILDPIADKILTLSAFLIFMYMSLIPMWMALVIVFRELLITGIRFSAIKKGQIMAAERLGKYKTVAQIVAIFTILIFLVLKASLYTSFPLWNNKFNLSAGRGIYFLMLIAVFLTLISGCSYIIKNRVIFLNAKMR